MTVVVIDDCLDLGYAFKDFERGCGTMLSVRSSRRIRSWRSYMRHVRAGAATGNVRSRLFSAHHSTAEAGREVMA